MRLGAGVDPRVEMIAHADFSRVNGRFSRAETATGSAPARVWLDNETGEVVAVGERNRRRNRATPER